MKAKEKIFEFLSKRKIETQTTTRIAALHKIDYHYALKLLQELESENKVERVKVGEYTGWKIKVNQ